MGWELILLLMLGGLVALLVIGLPVAFAFLAVNIVGAILILGGDPGLLQLVRNNLAAAAQFALLPIPLFILMGEVMLHSKLAERAIDAIDRLISGVPGRLSLVAIAGGTVFSALSGSSIANTAMLGSTLMPQMRARGYHPTIAMGPIIATGGIAILIPPSALAVLLGSLAKIDITALLIGGILPGAMMAGFFFAYIIIRCGLNPALAPVYDIAQMGWWDRIRPFLVNVVPLSGIFVAVVGSILAGWATPTDSAALGAVATFAAAACYGRLSWRVVRRSVAETLKVTVMILFILAASITFSQILAFSGATNGLGQLIQDANLAPWAVMLGMMLILLFLGCFIDQVSMMMMTLPFFMPLVQAYGFDPIWFGVLMLIAIEIGLFTPPFGLLLFVMKGVAPPDITMRQIMASIVPFLIMALMVMVILGLFPDLALWLPRLIERG